MSNIVVTPGGGVIQVGLGGTTSPINVGVGTTGPPGPKGDKGDKGDEGGTPVVAVAYDDWPPINPQPDTLYLRLVP